MWQQVKNWLSQYPEQWLNFSPPARIGLDIDSTSIILVDVAKQGKQFILENFAVESLPFDASSKDDTISAQAVTDAIKAIKQRVRIDTDIAHIAAPANYVATTKSSISVHSTGTQKKIHAKTEIKKAFPDTYKDLYYDYVVQDMSDDATGLKKTMLIIAAQKQKMQARIESIAAASLTVKVIDVDYYAIERSYALFEGQLDEKTKSQHLGILNIDSGSVSLVVLNSGKAVYQKRNSAHNDYLATLINHYFSRSGENYIAAEKELMAKQRSEKLETAIQHLLSECEQLVAGLPVGAESVNLGKIVLSGRCAVIAGIDSLVHQKTGISTLRANPFSNMVIGENIEQADLDRYTSAALLACGIAIHGLV